MPRFCMAAPKVRQSRYCGRFHIPCLDAPLLGCRIPRFRLTFAGWVRKLTGKPVIAVGSVTLANDSKSEMGKIFGGGCAG